MYITFCFSFIFFLKLSHTDTFLYFRLYFLFFGFFCLHLLFHLPDFFFCCGDFFFSAFFFVLFCFCWSNQQMSHRNKQAQQERNKEKGMESVPLNCAKCGATPCPHVVSPTEDAEDQNAMMSPERPPRSRQSLHSSAGGSQYGGNKRPDSTSSAQFRVESEMGHIATSDEEAVRPTNPAMIVSDIEDAVSAAEQGRVSAEQSQAVTKAPPIHPIRIAKTIDVISRVTFPTAFSCFLIFFFARYAWFAYMWNER
ncbi:unnamed protein product [Notodromas monacha]|uniref:Uncharacterized protein n=1 Tax=Notodromas monacha TaxID=399045 RepID=A0A7R9GDK4_9CRUS|nr:unnamed protein product [Notodromas monacha]CAG0918773.1 unnamed protein product [Notodromas monacha]